MQARAFRPLRYVCQRETMLQSRDRRIDVARGLGILLIVLGHNWLILGSRALPYRLLYSFHVPLFFVLSGICLRSATPFSRFLVQRADALLKPYFAALLLWGGMVYLGRWLATGTEGSSAYVYFGGVAYGTGSTIVWAPLWFLPCLFLSSIFARAIVHCGEDMRYGRGLLACVLYVGGIAYVGSLGPHSLAALDIVDSKAAIGWPWSLDLVPVATAFILAGYFWRDRVFSVTLDWRVLAAALALFVACHAVFEQTMQMNERDFGQPIVATTEAASGIILCLACAAVVERLMPCVGYVLIYFGRRALFLLIFHSAFQDWLFMGTADVIPDPVWRAIGSLSFAVFAPALLWELVVRNSLLKTIFLPLRS